MVSISLHESGNAHLQYGSIRGKRHSPRRSRTAKIQKNASFCGLLHCRHAEKLEAQHLSAVFRVVERHGEPAAVDSGGAAIVLPTRAPLDEGRVGHREGSYEKY